ncbi:MAG: ABC transporter ATP-binding protein [Kiritimatiellae bacterium]|nr:ABC transporter ATP-binding protein [Kiritimatiellia bacterium]MDD5519340.1 ABC transporter ATP-binding protein [Kiritimatiellia bacterium]
MDEQKENDVIVEVHNLVKVFKDFWQRPKVRAVDGLDLEIRRGEIFGLLGPNGSGKSTTIKILLGLLHATSGNVLVFNRSPRDVEIKARIGYLPEESYLYNYLSPCETLNFYGRLFDLKNSVRKERIWQLLEMTGLTHAANRSVGEFSKGMARRVGLAQALINDPELVILDEPTSGLDPVGCRQVKDLMLTLAKRGKTIILSSHLLADVEDVCDRIAILYNGSIKALGSVNQLLEKQESVRFTMPSLSPDVMKKVLELIREKIGKEPEVDHPSMNLEQFFLEVVEKAHKATSQQSGVAPTERMADYLLIKDK